MPRGRARGRGAGGSRGRGRSTNGRRSQEERNITPIDAGENLHADDSNDDSRPSKRTRSGNPETSNLSDSAEHAHRSAPSIEMHRGRAIGGGRGRGRSTNNHESQEEHNTIPIGKGENLCMDDAVHPNDDSRSSKSTRGTNGDSRSRSYSAEPAHRSEPSNSSQSGTLAFTRIYLNEPKYDALAEELRIRQQDSIKMMKESTELMRKQGQLMTKVMHMVPKLLSDQDFPHLKKSSQSGKDP